MSAVQTESGVNISMEVEQSSSGVCPPISRAYWSYWLTGDEETDLVRVMTRRKNMILSRIIVTVLLVLGLV